MSDNSTAPTEIKDILAQTEKLLAERGDEYGGDANLELIALMWSLFIGKDISPTQVCFMMAIIKMLRASSSPKHIDSHDDFLGYAALARYLLTKKRG